MNDEKEQEPNYEQMAKEARAQRAAQASAEIQLVLQKHNCDLLPVINIVGTQIQAAVQIVAKA